MDIGNKLKELRVLKGLTQEELADRSELSKGFISQLERNLTSPSITTLMDILQCLGTSIGEFFNETPEEQIVFGKTDYFEKHDLELATRVEPLEEVVDKIRTKLKNRHVKRLQTGECTIEMGFVFSDLLTNLERVSDHCSNIAVYLIQENDESFDVHEYVQMLKNSGEGFDGQVKRYSEKYALPAKEF